GRGAHRQELAVLRARPSCRDDRVVTRDRSLRAMRFGRLALREPPTKNRASWVPGSLRHPASRHPIVSARDDRRAEPPASPIRYEQVRDRPALMETPPG